MSKSIVPTADAAVQRLTPEQQRQVIDNIGLAQSQASKSAWGVVRRMGVFGNDRGLHQRYYDELLDAAVIGLCVATQKFNPKWPNKDKPGEFVKFSTYAHWWILNYVQKALPTCDIKIGPRSQKYCKQQQRVMTFSECLALGQCDERNPDIDVWDDRDREEEVKATDELLALLGLALDGRDLEAIRLRYVEGLTLQQVGKEFGVGKERARQIIMEAMDRLKRCPGAIHALEAQARRAQLNATDMLGVGLGRRMA